MNIIDTFIYKYAEQFRLTMKGMMNGKLSKDEKNTLDSLSADDMDIINIYDHPHNPAQTELEKAYMKVMDTPIGPDILSQIKFYNLLNEMLLASDEKEDIINSYLYRIYIRGFNFFHPVSPLLITKQNMVFPSYFDLKAKIENYVGFLESIERVKTEDSLPEIIEFFISTSSMTDLLCRMEQILAPEAVKNITNAYPITTLQNIRSSVSDIVTNEEGIIDYRLLMILKYLDELVYSLEP